MSDKYYIVGVTPKEYKLLKMFIYRIGNKIHRKLTLNRVEKLYLTKDDSFIDYKVFYSYHHPTYGEAVGNFSIDLLDDLNTQPMKEFFAREIRKGIEHLIKQKKNV